MEKGLSFLFNFSFLDDILKQNQLSVYFSHVDISQSLQYSHDPSFFEYLLYPLHFLSNELRMNVVKRVD